MNSKERLEETVRTIKNNWVDERYSMLRDALDYVISEAEQVQELEDIKNEYMKSHYEELRINDKLMEQVKHYRGAIENINHTWIKADNIYNHVEMIQEVIKKLGVRPKAKSFNNLTEEEQQEFSEKLRTWFD